MQEIRYDGEERLTSRVTPEDFERALAGAENVSVALHREGSIVRAKNGRVYRVNALGQWCRVREVTP